MLRVADEFHGSHTGRMRRDNEDALYARPPLFAVADGMGGAQAGEVASGIAVETLRGGSADDAAALERLVQDANARIHEASQADERQAGMGTTMTAVLVDEDEIHVAHVGDSRAYLLRGGRLEKLTRDHSLVDELVRQGKLTPEEAEDHPQRSVITRVLGPEAPVEVDLETWQARDGDVFLLCSDGLTSMVPERDVERLLTSAASLREAGRALIDAANDAGGRDNITVILLRLEDVGGVGGAGAEQDTSTGETALRTADVAAAVEAEDRRRAPRGTAGHAAPVATMDPPTTAVPVARRLQPSAPQPPRRRRRRLRRALLLASVVGTLLFVVFIAAFSAVRSVYFVGADDQGYVTVFRGLPYELPFGVDLYERNYTSPVTRDEVPVNRRTTVLTDQELRSQSDAYDLVRQLERGELR